MSLLNVLPEQDRAGAHRCIRSDLAAADHFSSGPEGDAAAKHRIVASLCTYRAPLVHQQEIVIICLTKNGTNSMDDDENIGKWTVEHAVERMKRLIQ